MLSNYMQLIIKQCQQAVFIRREIENNNNIDIIFKKKVKTHTFMNEQFPEC